MNDKLTADKLCIIMRGLPGSGKSTWLKKFSQERAHTVCSADHFFLDSAGNYQFRPWEIGQAHAACQSQFIEAISSSGSRPHCVVVDNTNTQRWEYANYVKLARLFGYTVAIVEMECDCVSRAKEYAARNSHGVPEEGVLKMYERWEAEPAIDVARLRYYQPEDKLI